MNRRLIWVAVGLFICQFASAQEMKTDPQFQQMTGQQYIEAIEEMADLGNRAQLQTNTSYQINKTTVDDECMTFLSADQFLGDTGRSIFQKITENSKQFPNLLKGGDINHYCSKYSSMGLKQKGLIWVTILTMMAQFESSCKIKAFAKGPNGRAQGYFQLHKGQEQKYSEDSKDCVKNASMNAKLSSACTLAMLDDQMEKSNGVLFSPKSYWDVLRPHGRAKKAALIARTISRSSLCNPRSL
jgi:hypothetical protein